MSRRRGGLRHRLEYALVRSGLAADRLLGRRVTDAIAAGAGRLAYRPFRIRASVVEAHLRQAFPGRDEAWIRRTASSSYAHLGREGLSMLRLARLGHDDVLAATEVEGLDSLEAAVAAGRGAIMVSGHFGNWELGGAALAARGIPLDVMVRRQENPYFDALINRARTRLGMRVIDRHAPTRTLVQSLRAGRVLALVADQDARDAGLFVPFLGRPASTYRGPAVLALRSGVPLFIGTAARHDDGRYAVRLSRIEAPDLPVESEARVRALTASHVAALEAAIRSAPEQYLWHHRRWKTAPPAGNGGFEAEA